LSNKTQLCCVQKKGQKTTQRSCEKRGKKIQVASPHHLFYLFSFYVFSVSRSIGTGYFIRFQGFKSTQIKKFSTITKTTLNPLFIGLWACFFPFPFFH